jgi:hypothetical protein
LRGVLALDEHSLLETIDLDLDLFRDAAYQRHAALIEKRFWSSWTEEKHDADKDEQRDEQHSDDGHDDTLQPFSKRSATQSVICHLASFDCPLNIQDSEQAKPHDANHRRLQVLPVRACPK